ncbi:MAG: DEAD/DEAH box helicase [Proteobacteria bacterium]|nr:DEAD/DEAH box helicase [Pseudomonadota bacterium]MBU1688941.1 DEAD/DEAH box helicase [Pseudomonadota bacterium]
MSFTKFSFNPQIMAGIQNSGYVSPTPIQSEAIPAVLTGRDLLGLAQTGTGKTAAFVLPILQRLLDGPRRNVRALIIAPTRELAEQINDNIINLAGKTGLRSVTIYGGVSKVGQVRKLAAGVEIVVACPGRLLDILADGAIDLSMVNTLVLDEADMMFDMGFMPAIRRVLKHIPKQRQNLLFSATMPDAIRLLANEILRDPVTVQIDHAKPLTSIAQRLYQVEKNRKSSLLMALMRETEMSSALIFTKTKYGAKKLAGILEKSGYRATSIQGNLSQSKRQQALDGFREGKYQFLVATDIAARGIDVTGISHVINYDVPDTVESYTHRIGRTGRANRSGEALTFASNEDRGIILAIERTIGQRLERHEVSAELVETVVDRRELGIQSRPAKSGFPGVSRSGRPSSGPSRPRGPKDSSGRKNTAGGRSPSTFDRKSDTDGRSKESSGRNMENGNRRSSGPAKRKGRSASSLGLGFLRKPSAA